ncbi:Methyl-CpG-binding domain-containing protein 13 [Linum perenne]
MLLHETTCRPIKEGISTAMKEEQDRHTTSVFHGRASMVVEAKKQQSANGENEGDSSPVAAAMDSSKSDDWLPEGWRVQVNVRKNGRKDKWYFPPTGGAKFFSKLEVTRYLKRNSNIDNGDNNSTSNLSAENKSSNSKNSSRSYNNEDPSMVSNARIGNMVDSNEGIHSDTSTKTVGAANGSNGTVTPTSENHNITSSRVVGMLDSRNNLDAINLTSSKNSMAVTTPTSKNHDDIKESNQTPNTEEKEGTGTHKKSYKKVTYEKEKAEGLPPGWTKEVKLTKKGRKVRRDPYYTDPEGSYTFRSLKDALRYVETGEPGKLAIRRREPKCDEDDDDEDEKSPASAKKQKLGTTDDSTNGTSLKASEMTHPVPKVLSDMPAFKQHGQSSKVSEVVAPPSDAQAMQDEEADPSLEVIETMEEEHSTGKSNNKKKKDVPLPRRSSKRLAREAGRSEPEKSSAAAVKLSSETDATVSLDSATSVLDTQLRRTTLVKQTVNASEEKNSPPHQLEMNHHLNTTTSVSRKPASKLNKSKQPSVTVATTTGTPPLELWEDPCIAFAIKTLTGSLDEPDSINNMPPGSTTSKSHPGNEMPGGASLNLPTTNRQPEPVNAPGSPVNMSAAYSWADPCIEFAIKTLTGAIPLDANLFKQDSQRNINTSRPNSAPVFHQPTAVSPPAQAPATTDPSSGGSTTTRKRVTRSQRKAV